MKTLKDHKEYLADLMCNRHYIVECDYCKTKLFCDYNDFVITKYEPVMKEFECAEIGEDGKYHWGKKIELASSDQNKDIYECKCCYCGHPIKRTRREILKNVVQWTGDNTIWFDLSEEETKRANEFIEKHKECARKIGDPIGTSFVFEIMPTSIGTFTKIKCLGCKEELNLTEYDKF